MMKDISRARLAGMWVAAVIVVAACSVFWGIALTLNNGALWLVACVVPPAVMYLVWRGAPPITVAELLYSVDRPSKDTRL
jgi:hypothetical protein